MERLIIVNRTDDAPVNSRQWIDPAINKKMMMMIFVSGMVKIVVLMMVWMRMMTGLIILAVQP